MYKNYKAKNNISWAVLMILFAILLIAPVFCAEPTYRDVSDSDYAVVEISGSFSDEGRDTLISKINNLRKQAKVKELKYSPAAEKAAQIMATEYSIDRYAILRTKELTTYVAGGKDTGYTRAQVQVMWSKDKKSAEYFFDKYIGINSFAYTSENHKYIGCALVHTENAYYYAVAIIPEEDKNIKVTHGNMAQKTVVSTSKLGGLIIDGNSEVAVGKSMKLSASVTVNGYIESFKSLVTGAEWSSSDTSVATVTSDGKVKGISAGKTKITVKAGGKKASKEITVKGTDKKDASKNSASYKINKVTLKVKNKSIEVSWKKPSKKIMGYELQYSTDKNFKKNVKTINIKKSLQKKTIKKLKNGKTYYVRIRAVYKKNNDMKTASWSKTKKIKLG